MELNSQYKNLIEYFPGVIMISSAYTFPAVADRT